MTTYECLSLVATFLTLGVLSWTLCVLKEYTRATKRLVGTSFEQLPRPCVVLKRSTDPSDEAILAGETASLIGDNYYASHLIFMNVGTGPAVNCRYRVRDMGKTRREEPSYHLPEIGPSASFEGPHILNSLPENAVVLIEYESVAGSYYLTDVTIKERRWVQEIRFTRPHSHAHPRLRLRLVKFFGS